MLHTPLINAKVARASVRPLQTLDLLSQKEMTSLATTDQEIHQVFRRCALAILNTDGEIDDAAEIYSRFSDFEIRIVPEPRGLKIELFNAPARAFVDGEMIQGIRGHLFSALRDIVFTHHKLLTQQHFDLDSGEGITDAVFRILRNADIVRTNLPPNLIVCWGGHSIPREEYDFSKEVGYHLGLRYFDIATGCGPGAMKGPMKGATIGHAKQLNRSNRCIGISEPGIIAAESPNPLVNELVILPDIEKRLEAFVRVAHGIVVFPGGVGTAEEILYLIGLKMNPKNAGIPLPVIMAVPSSGAEYVKEIDGFIRRTLGDDAAGLYEIILGDAAAVAVRLKELLKSVKQDRKKRQESYGFNWGLTVPEEFQKPFDPTHETMAALRLHRQQPPHQLAADLRRAFSGIVAGNVKDFGVRAVQEKGPYELHGEPEVVQMLEKLLQAFVRHGRMKLDTANYTPCFRLVS